MPTQPGRDPAPRRDRRAGSVNDHLELLFEFGLGQDTGGPWLARLGDALSTPASMLRGQLAWAITHGMTDRVRLLAEHGVDVAAPFEDGDTPAAVARTTGHARPGEPPGQLRRGRAQPDPAGRLHRRGAGCRPGQPERPDAADCHPDLVAETKLMSGLPGRADTWPSRRTNLMLRRADLSVARAAGAAISGPPSGPPDTTARTPRRQPGPWWSAPDHAPDRATAKTRIRKPNRNPICRRSSATTMDPDPRRSGNVPPTRGIVSRLIIGS